MPDHVNFYENLKEAHLRLRNTIVLYDGDPFFVGAICDHRKDGVLRIYLVPLLAFQGEQPLPDFNAAGREDPALGQYLDKYIADNSNTSVLRKKMSSALFNKYRPFPLGMCNTPDGRACYIERQPTRHTEQGLTRQMLFEVPVSLAIKSDKPRSSPSVEVYSSNFKDCIKGDHPSAAVCLSKLLDPKIINEAVAFNRRFAFVRGPVDMIFLAYKEDIIGCLPRADLSEVRIGREFTHCREVVEELNIFNSVL